MFHLCPVHPLQNCIKYNCKRLFSSIQTFNNHAPILRLSFCLKHDFFNFSTHQIHRNKLFDTYSSRTGMQEQRLDVGEQRPPWESSVNALILGSRMPKAAPDHYCLCFVWSDRPHY